MKKVAITLQKPYVFEGETHTEIDMVGFEDLKGSQLFSAEQRYLSVRNNPVGMEYTYGFCFALGSIVLNKPVEFFSELPAVDANSFRNWVTCFLQGMITITEEDGTSDEPQ